MTGISLKASLAFVLALYGVDLMKLLNLINFSFNAPTIFEKNKQTSLAMDFLLAVHLVSMFGFGWKNSFDHFPEFIWVFFKISQGKLAVRFLCKS